VVAVIKARAAAAALRGIPNAPAEARDESVFQAAGLQWQREPAPEQMSWGDAKSYCAGLGLSGSGWRLPSKEELLLCTPRRSCPLPSLRTWDGQRFFWSSSPVIHSAGAAWAVYFSLATAASTPRALASTCGVYIEDGV